MTKPLKHSINMQRITIPSECLHVFFHPKRHSYDRILSIRNGFKSAFPILIGYLPTAVMFCIAGTATGLFPFQVLMMSALIFAGASQFYYSLRFNQERPLGWVVMPEALNRHAFLTTRNDPAWSFDLITEVMQ
ncbi:hypothetical protein D9O50_07395 [Oxalobacteraceae bacterium CAVE-383]|nr:hypothetical protein D9O50_07395 [Oxalobacteraceae bacterium CAVE-383]